MRPPDVFFCCSLLLLGWFLQESLGTFLKSAETSNENTAVLVESFELTGVNLSVSNYTETLNILCSIGNDQGNWPCDQSLNASSAVYCDWLNIVCDNDTIVELSISGTQSGFEVLSSFLLKNLLFTCLDTFCFIPESLCSISSLQVLEADGLSGIIPDCIGNLNLTTLTLSNNHLSGTIPSSIGNLTQLQYLILHDNAITGTIPESIGACTQLVDMWLDNNLLSGSLPVSIGSLVDVKYLFAESNFLTGPIPYSVGNCTQLYSVGLSSNALSGTLPLFLCDSHTLAFLYLDGNAMTGTIPSSMGRCYGMTFLWLSNNQFTGSIPRAIGHQNQMWGLYLDGNLLSGPIPYSFKWMEELSDLWLFNNQLTGTIPQYIGLFADLYSLDVGRNHLSGSIPSTIGNRTSMVELILTENQLTGSLPDSLANLTYLGEVDISYNAITGTLSSQLCFISELNGGSVNIVNTSMSCFGDCWTNTTEEVFEHDENVGVCIDPDVSKPPGSSSRYTVSDGAIIGIAAGAVGGIVFLMMMTYVACTSRYSKIAVMEEATEGGKGEEIILND